MSIPSEFAGQAAGIYPRVSSKKQAREEKTSLSDQEKACREYADELGMVVDRECVRWEAESATTMDRPELNTLLADMRARHVPNLIIDTVDRLTRQGKLAAAQFLSRFIEAGITLHVVSLDLVVPADTDDDAAIDKLLDAAGGAKQDNVLRSRKSKRTKRSRALKGTFNRGNHAPYGYRYVPVIDDEGNVREKRLKPDERPYADRGFLNVFATTPYRARQRILALAEAGASYQAIANQLNADHVPTASQLLRRSGTSGVWYARTVNEIIRHPINEGKLFNTFRVPGKKKGEYTTERIEITVDAEHGTLAPLLDERAAAILAERRKRNLETYYSRASIHSGRALLGGRLARCGCQLADGSGVCGATLRVKGSQYKGMYYLYYVCTRHDKVPGACPGLTLPVRGPEGIDKIAWGDVTAALFKFNREQPHGDSYMDILARIDEERTKKTGTRPADRLRELRATRASFVTKVTRYVEELGETESKLTRSLIQEKIAVLEPEIAKADSEIAEEERQLEQAEQRARVLAGFLDQFRLYADAIDSLNPDREEDIPVMKALLRAVGARFTLDPDVLTRSNATGEEPYVDVELTLTPMSALPWLTPEEMTRLIDEGRKHAIHWWEDDSPEASTPVASEPSPVRRWCQRRVLD